MIVVGSRCGGHDFFIELPDKPPLWIGANQKSDLDVLLFEGQDRPSVAGFFVDVWRGRLGDSLPHCNDGVLFIPQNLHYLQRVAKRRVRHKYGVGYVKSLWDKELNFLNKDGSFFARLKMTRHIYK